MVFKYVLQLLRRSTKISESRRERIPELAQTQLDGYLQTSREFYNHSENPLVFWLTWQLTYSAIASLALDILCIPASSRPIKHVFPMAGEATVGKRNRFIGSNLEREALLKKNKVFL